MRNKIFLLLIITSSLLLYSCGTTNLSEQDNNPTIAPLEEENNEVAPETTSIPKETITEEPIPTESSTNSSETSQINPQSDSNSLCDHPYFPIVDGASWTYDASMDEDYTLRIEETGDDSFKMIQEMHSDDLIYTVDWFCSEDGILRGSFGQADLLNQAASNEETPEFQFETLEWEGQTLPSPELLDIGHTWTSFYQLAASFDVEGFSQSMNMDVIVDHEIIGMEEVIVPAGTFPEALRVDSDGQINMFLVMDEERTPVTSVNFGYSTWYVEGIGMVKTSSEVTGYSTDVSLTDSSLID
jgi:hypothetical protein